MTRSETRFTTDRLTLRSWRVSDADDFARLHANPETMGDYRGPLDRATSDKKLKDYIAQYDAHGFIRWRVATLSGDFLGYVGLYPNGDDHPLGAHGDIGWRFLRSAWGQGYATEAARATLQHAFEHNGLSEILAYTQVENTASQAVIARLGLHRDTSRDFSIDDKFLNV